jgi:imidazolonepropionase-like amidohydrolase
MRPISLLVFLMTAALLAKAQRGDFIFTHVNVIPMNKELVILDQMVTVRNGRIQSIKPTTNKKISSDNTVIDCKGKFLMPGLAEMHAHIPPVSDLEPMKTVLKLFLANGVTTIRGMLGHPLHIELREKVKNGSVMGPRIYTSGPSFSGRTVASPEQGVAMVIQQKNLGYDFLKLHPGLSKEIFLAIAKTAKEQDIPFAGHVSADVGVWLAINSGYATIDHMDGFIEALVRGIDHMKPETFGPFGMFIGDLADTSLIPKLMTELKQHNIWVVPTEALARRWFSPLRTAEEFAADPEMAYIDKATLANWVQAKKNIEKDPFYDKQAVLAFIELRKKLVNYMNAYGVNILLGSDAPQVFDVPGFSIHQELKYYVESGMTPYEALTTGTSNVGRFLKRDDIGRIRTGARADLILLDENPLLSIDNTKKIAGVMAEGRWYSKEFLEDQLEQIKRSNQQ